MPEAKLAATRDGLRPGLVKAGQDNSQVVALCADLTGSLRLDKFAQQFPDRFIQVGVAEQNLVGTAAGLALAGKIPFAASFAAFSPGRTFDQIRCSVAYSNLNVKIIGGHAGLATGPDGATHQMLEDLAMMRALPNMTVVEPCDAWQTEQAVLALAKHHGPAYLRLSRPKLPTLTNKKDEFKLGQAQVLQKGTDLVLMACGIGVHIGLQTAHLLAKKGIAAGLINLHTIKPLDTQAIIKAADQTNLIISLEDHQISGGLGGAIAQTLHEQYLLGKIKVMPKLKTIGVKDQFGESGKYQELYQKYGLNANKVAKQALALV